MSDWKYVVFSYTAPECRSGWVGVWDAVVSAVKRQPRYEVAKTYQLKMWVNQPVSLGNLEVKSERENVVNLNGFFLDGKKQ